MHDFKRCPCSQACYLSAGDISLSHHVIFIKQPAFPHSGNFAVWLGCHLLPAMAEISLTDIVLKAVIFFWWQTSFFVYNSGRYLHLMLYLPFENCVDSKLTWLFSMDLFWFEWSIHFVCIMLWTVYVTSSSKVGWHCQPSANLRAAMKWSGMKYNYWSPIFS